MKRIKLILMLCFAAHSYFCRAQAEYAVDKGAAIISGSVGFSSSGGDLYGSERSSVISLTPSVSAFAAKNFFLGGALSLAYQSQGGDNITSIQIGPHLGYAGGNASSKAFPFFLVGARYRTESISFDSFFGNDSYTLTGYNVLFGAGAIVAVSSHLGITFEGDFNFVNLGRNGVSESGNEISLNIGLCGLLFKGQKK